MPCNEQGKRIVNGWEFHYQGWERENKKFQCGATTSNFFPKEMEGCLDADELEKLGLDCHQMNKCDALFFFQLILPLCDPVRSGINNDPCHTYHTEVPTCIKLNLDLVEAMGFHGSLQEHVSMQDLMEC